jgi:glutamyl-tRNA synthetase
MRSQAMAEKRPSVYDGRWRDRDPKDAPVGVAPAIRFKAPREGEIVIDDQVQGRVVFSNKELDDLIILRSDGAPTYNLSVVVDDHDMGVTHIIRGVDHLTNAARQAQIYAALGWKTPVFAHVPLIHGPDGAKLSKRHGAMGVEAYRAMGYLPAALRNYLVRLGWGHGDEEIFSTEQAIEWFGLEAIGRSPSRFDFAKLENLNGHYIRGASDAELVRRARDVLPEAKKTCDLVGKIDEAQWAKFEQAMPGLKERAKTIVELIDSARYLFAERPLSLDDKAKGVLSEDARRHLTAVANRLEAAAKWDGALLEEIVRGYVSETGLKLGAVAQPLRAALTGRATSPGVFDVLSVLGRDESLGRIRDQAL